LADDREVHGSPLGSGKRKHDLVRERGLARAGRADDEIEGELRQASAEYLVEPRHAGRELSNRNLVGHSFFPFGCASENPSGHAFCRYRVVSGSPISVVSSSANVANIAAAASVAADGTWLSSQRVHLGKRLIRRTVVASAL